MKLNLSLVALAIVLLNSPHDARAGTVLEETAYLFGFSGETYSFVADQASLVYEVILTDLEFPAAFDVLGVAITTSTENVAELLAPGTTEFTAEFGTKYFANVLGLADESAGAGLFGIKIASVPEPGTALLLAAGVAALAALRRRN